MKFNLGQLLQAVETLDSAASRAPLSREDHSVAQNCSGLLRAALPELWKNQKPAPKSDEPKTPSAT